MFMERLFNRHMHRATSRSVSRTLAPVIAACALIAMPMVMSAQPVTPPWREVLPDARPRVTATVGGAKVIATVARSSPEQSLGLGYRDGLEAGTGMLFVYREPSARSFWMKGMRFCLDIIWIEGDEVVGAAESVCPEPVGTPDSDLPSYRSPEPVRYILEVPAGWMAENGVMAGSPVVFDPDPSTLLESA